MSITRTRSLVRTRFLLVLRWLLLLLLLLLLRPALLIPLPRIQHQRQDLQVLKTRMGDSVEARVWRQDVQQQGQREQEWATALTRVCGVMNRIAMSRWENKNALQH